MYPDEQAHVSGAVQLPWLLQTIGLVLIILLQIGELQNVPLYPLLHTQTFGDLHVP